MGMLTQFFFAFAIGTFSTLTKKLRFEIAERKKVEIQLKEYQDNLEDRVKQRTKELETANETLLQIEKMEAIGQLAGGVAHDFNNQLTIILGYCDILKVALEENPELQDYAERIYCSGKRAADLTKQLLAFARKGKYKSQAVNINEISSEALVLLSRSIDKKIVVSQDFNAQQPFIWGDPTQIQNAIINLALNARDAMEKGGELILKTGNEEVDQDFCDQHNLNIKPGAYITVSVMDTGIGIDEKHLKRIFEPFFTTKEEGKGTGMGLAAVYGIAKTHNGGIWVQSKVGVGSTFKLYFPQIPAPDLNSQPAAEKRSLSVQKSNHILIIDDEKDVAMTIKDMLERLGYKITIKTTSREAIDYYLYTWEKVDLVLLDMIMPEINGRELFYILKKINPQIKAILSSGYGLTSQVKEILQEGVLLFIQKPYTMAEIAAKVQEILCIDKSCTSLPPC
jgi:signal transduction histidine kinase/CheY-like chemotaxis protein